MIFTEFAPNIGVITLKQNSLTSNQGLLRGCSSWLFGMVYCPSQALWKAPGCLCSHFLIYAKRQSLLPKLNLMWYNSKVEANWIFSIFYISPLWGKIIYQKPFQTMRNSPKVSLLTMRNSPKHLLWLPTTSSKAIFKNFHDWLIFWIENLLFLGRIDEDWFLCLNKYFYNTINIFT